MRLSALVIECASESIAEKSSVPAHLQAAVQPVMLLPQRAQHARLVRSRANLQFAVRKVRTFIGWDVGYTKCGSPDPKLPLAFFELAGTRAAMADPNSGPVLNAHNPNTTFRLHGSQAFKQLRSHLSCAGLKNQPKALPRVAHTSGRSQELLHETSTPHLHDEAVVAPRRQRVCYFQRVRRRYQLVKLCGAHRHEGSRWHHSLPHAAAPSEHEPPSERGQPPVRPGSR